MGSVSDATLLHIVIYMAYVLCIVTWSHQRQQVIDIVLYDCYSYRCSQNIKYVPYVIQILIFSNVVPWN
jgi:hypothetical protein